MAQKRTKKKVASKEEWSFVTRVRNGRLEMIQIKRAAKSGSRPTVSVLELGAPSKLKPLIKEKIARRNREKAAKKRKGGPSILFKSKSVGNFAEAVLLSRKAASKKARKVQSSKRQAKGMLSDSTGSLALKAFRHAVRDAKRR